MKTTNPIYWAAVATFLIVVAGCDAGYEYEEEESLGSIVPDPEAAQATEASH